MPISPDTSDNSLALLSRLLFSNTRGDDTFRGLSEEQLRGILALANSNHVVVRSLDTFRGLMAEAGDCDRHDWATEALAREQARIEVAVSFLQEMCRVLSAEGCEVIVIKSLDHWPDLGSDLDLYTNAEPARVIRTMNGCFSARVASRSWGDRLANKWNFIVPGLPELVEIHMGRLGQTGELVDFASALPTRARTIKVDGRMFKVPAPEHRLMICTLQRMYRHFFIRLCDIADTVELLETGAVNYAQLHDWAEVCGIWEGVATFLVNVSDYAEDWRGRGVALPASVRSAARFGGEEIGFARGFLRVPILPHSVRLYASEWATLMSQRQFRNTARLSLLPWLATAAALGQKITGSDKGIW
jgi:hypothetical protein